MTAIYHITHLDNLGSILESGGLFSENAKAARGLAPVSIAHQHIKDRRGRRRIPVARRGTLNDYVPFYFAPRSPMLFAIHKGSVQGYSGGQAPILHLMSSIETIVDADLPFGFSDGHAEMAVSDIFDDLKSLTKIDWQIMKAVYWNDNEDDNDRCRRRMAEFLVHEFFPWRFISTIGVINKQMAEKVRDVIRDVDHHPEVRVERGWYY